MVKLKKTESHGMKRRWKVVCFMPGCRYFLSKYPVNHGHYHFSGRLRSLDSTVASPWLALGHLPSLHDVLSEMMISDLM